MVLAIIGDIFAASQTVRCAVGAYGLSDIDMQVGRINVNNRRL